MFFSSKNPLFINLVFTFFIQPSWNVPTKAHQPSFSHIFSTEILTPCGVKRTATGGCTRKIICSTNVAETSVTVRTPRWFGGFWAFMESSRWVGFGFRGLFGCLQNGTMIHAGDDWRPGLGGGVDPIQHLVTRWS